MSFANRRKISTRIARLVKSAREAGGISQSVLASSLGMSRNDLSEIEMDQSEVNVVTWLEVSQIFEIDPSSVLTREAFLRQLHHFIDFTKAEVLEDVLGSDL